MVGYILIGLLAGLLGGAFGIGGGALIVPALIILMKVETHVAIGTSLAAIIFISMSGAIRHYTLHNLDLHLVLLISLGGIIGAVIGATLVDKIPPIYAKRALAVFLLYSAIRLWLSK